MKQFFQGRKLKAVRNGVWAGINLKKIRSPSFGTSRAVPWVGFLQMLATGAPDLQGLTSQVQYCSPLRKPRIKLYNTCESNPSYAMQTSPSPCALAPGMFFSSSKRSSPPQPSFGHHAVYRRDQDFSLAENHSKRVAIIEATLQQGVSVLETRRVVQQLHDLTLRPRNGLSDRLYHLRDGVLPLDDQGGAVAGWLKQP